SPATHTLSLHDALPISDDQSAIRNPQSAIAVTFPLPQSAHRPEVEVAAQLRAAGFVRAQLDGAVVRLDGPDVERRVREAGEVLRSEEHTSELQSRGHLV